MDFVVEADRDQLGEIVKRLGDGRLRANIGAIASLDDAAKGASYHRMCLGRASGSGRRSDVSTGAHRRDGLIARRALRPTRGASRVSRLASGGCRADDLVGIEGAQVGPEGCQELDELSALILAQWC